MYSMPWSSPAIAGNAVENVSFPAFSSSLQITTGGLSAADPAQGASIIDYTSQFNGAKFSYRLIVPALNIDTTIQRDFIDFNGVSSGNGHLTGIQAQAEAAETKAS